MKYFFCIIGLHEAGNIERQENAGDGGALLPQVNGVNARVNNLPDGNGLQLGNQGLRQGNGHVQGQNQQQHAGSILGRLNFHLSKILFLSFKINSSICDYK